MMKDLTIHGLGNHVATLGCMMRTELAQEQKWLNNRRCKAPKWGSIASYIEYAFGLTVSDDEVEHIAHTYNWG